MLVERSLALKVWAVALVNIYVSKVVGSHCFMAERK